MMRFIADYRRFHIQSASMEGGQTNFYNTSFFTDVDFSSGLCEFKYDENERNAAKNYFIQEKGLLAKEAELISNRYYEHNTGYRKIPN